MINGAGNFLKSGYLVCIFLHCFLLAWPALAQESELTRLNREADDQRQRGDYQLGVSTATRALRLAESSFGPDHLDVARSLNGMALLYEAQGHYEQAEPLFKRALTIREKSLGPDHPVVAASLNNLATLYENQGLYGRSEPLLKRALAIREKSLGPDHPATAAGLNDLAWLYTSQGQYLLAESLKRRALEIREKSLGPNDPDVATSLDELGTLLRAQGKYGPAEPLLLRSLAIRENSLGPDHPAVAASLNDLATLYRDLGQYAQAEPLYKRSLTIREKSLGPGHPFVSSSLSDLALLYVTQGQYAQAEPLFKRSLAIREKSLGPGHPDLASSLNDLASLYRYQGQGLQAEPLFKRALSIREKSLGPDHPLVASSLQELAFLYQDRNEDGLAEPLLKRSLAILEKSLGPDHPNVAAGLGNLAVLYQDQEKFAQAEALYKRALTILEKSLGVDHPNLALILANLANIYGSQGAFDNALPLLRRASAIYRTRIVAAGTSESASREAAMSRGALMMHLDVLAINPRKEPSASIADEALQIVQLIQASGTASAVAKMAARFASGSDALAGLAKRKQDEVEHRYRTEEQLVKASGQPPEKRDAANEKRLRETVVRATDDIKSIDAELSKRFPAYQDLTRPEPLTVNAVRKQLHAGEAMLVYALGDFSYVWVVTQEKAVFRSLSAILRTVAAQVASVRSEMDFDDKGHPIKVSVDGLHALYKGLVEPIAADLTGISHVMVVPSGPLQSLPMGLLVAAPPPEIRSDADYGAVEWLAKRYAFSVLPSVSSIQAFRQFAKVAQVQQRPFAGFGDPNIGSGTSTTRGARAKLDMASVFRGLTLALAMGSAGTRGPEIADVESIRRAPRLPETADELRQMAKATGAGDQSVWLQNSATETQVKQMDLSSYRILAFATHGLMAGELKGVGEPGLIMTPPKVGSVEDDGYLAAGEISRLKLNADWVVLSACNTAAADGSPGAEGLSGLAKAFFYAGARSLLVSHWPVASEATVPLTTVMLKEYEANPQAGKAQAQRKAILALMNTPGHPEYAHPLFWAPFVVVGEGGAGLSAQRK